MLTEIIAYYVGKSAGQKSSRPEPDPPPDLTPSDIQRTRSLAFIFAVCALISIIATVIGDSP